MGVDLGRALLGAAAIHGAALGLLARTPPSLVAGGARGTIIVEVTMPARVPEIPPPPPPPPRRGGNRRGARGTTAGGQRTPKAGSRVTKAGPPHPPSAPTPKPPPAPAKPGPIDLFAPAALAKAAGSESPTVSPEPKASGGEEKGPRAPSAAEVVQGIVDDAVGANRAASGQVPPSVRGLERELEGRFRPPREAISSASRGEIAGDQVRRFNQVGPRSQPLPRGAMDPSTAYAGGPARELGVGVTAMEQQIAVAEGLNEPASWRRAEVRVRLDREGRLVEVVVARTSGRPALDALALEAVRAAVSARLDELHDAGACEARFALESAVSVRVPSSMLGGASLLGAVPFKESLHYRVTLVEFRAAK